MPRARIGWIVLSIMCLCILTAVACAQTSDDDGTKGTKIIFHVTSVSQQEDPETCQAAQCSATKFTIEGYADVQHDSHLTQYVLTCSEILASTPSPHFAITCGRVHANSDYDARLFADSIVFEGGKPKSKDDPPEAAYSIASEKEINKPHK
jgi:hypothetical protein